MKASDCLYCPYMRKLSKYGSHGKIIKKQNIFICY
jgi:hypothetical protein